MNSTNLYEKLEKERIFSISEVGIVLNSDIKDIEFDEILENFNNEKSFSNVRLLKSDNKILGNICFEGSNYEVKIDLINLEKTEEDFENIEFLANQNNLHKKELDEWKKANLLVVLEMHFNENCDKSYFAQLKMLNTISKNYVVLVDMTAQKVISSKWVKMLLKDNILPLNENLFSIHASYDDKANEVWFHTHGLNRCGCIELELLGINDEFSNNQELIKRVGAMFIERGIKTQDEEITAGYSNNKYLVYKWKPWQEATKFYYEKNKNFLGNIMDRDSSHMMPSGVLFAFEEEKFESPNIYTFLLKNNVVFFYTNEETEKLSKMCQIRLKYFKEVFEKEKDTSDFIVKAGFLADGNYNFDKEYLWFDIKEINENGIKGILMNEPYDVSNMQEGELYEINEQSIVDWKVYTQDFIYTADNIYKFYI